MSSGVLFNNGWTVLEEVLSWANFFARDPPVFDRSYLEGPRNLHNDSPYRSRPGLAMSLVSYRGPLSCGCAFPEELLGWDQFFARYSPIFGCRFLDAPHNLQS